MTNEEKAIEIAEMYNLEYEGKETSEAECYESAIEMAEWKDKEFEYILNIAFETVGEQNGRCCEDVFEYLQKIRELLRRE